MPAYDNYDHANAKPYVVLGETSEHARSTVAIECPHCETQFTAYKWSMAGSGKKCPKCGARHNWTSGTATPMRGGVQ